MKPKKYHQQWLKTRGNARNLYSLNLPWDRVKANLRAEISYMFRVAASYMHREALELGTKRKEKKSE